MIADYNCLFKQDEKTWFSFWNLHEVTACSNCYSYAIGFPYTFFNLGGFMHPGFKNNPQIWEKREDRTINVFQKRLMADGLKPMHSKGYADVPAAPKNHYLTAAFVTLTDLPEWCGVDYFNKHFRYGMPFAQRHVSNYHIVRQHADGRWSERNGLNGAVDWCMPAPDGNYPFVVAIESSPAFFVGYYAVPNTGLNIGIPKQLRDYKTNDEKLMRHSDLVKTLIDFDKEIEKITDCKQAVKLHADYADKLRVLLDETEWDADIYSYLTDIKKSQFLRIFARAKNKILSMG